MSDPIMQQHVYMERMDQLCLYLSVAPEGEKRPLSVLAKLKTILYAWCCVNTREPSEVRRAGKRKKYTSATVVATNVVLDALHFWTRKFHMRTTWVTDCNTENIV